MPSTSGTPFVTLKTTRRKRSWCSIRRIGRGAARDFVMSSACCDFNGARLCEPQQQPQFHTLEFIPTTPAGEVAASHRLALRKLARQAQLRLNILCEPAAQTSYRRTIPVCGTSSPANGSGVPVRILKTRSKVFADVTSAVTCRIATSRVLRGRLRRCSRCFSRDAWCATVKWSRSARRRGI